MALTTFGTSAGGDSPRFYTQIPLEGLNSPEAPRSGVNSFPNPNPTPFPIPRRHDTRFALNQGDQVQRGFPGSQGAPVSIVARTPGFGFGFDKDCIP